MATDILLTWALAGAVVGAVVYIAAKGRSGWRGGRPGAGSVLHTQGRGSGKLWHSWRTDAGTGLVVSRVDGRAYIALVKRVQPEGSTLSFSLRPASELKRAELILGGEVVGAVECDPDAENGVRQVRTHWPMSSDDAATAAVAGPVGIRVVLEPSAPEGYTFITGDGPVPAHGEVMLTTYGWMVRLTSMMAGNDFLLDRSDDVMLKSAVALECTQRKLDAMQAKLDALPRDDAGPAAGPTPG